MIQKSCSQLKQCIQTCTTWDINNAFCAAFWIKTTNPTTGWNTPLDNFSNVHQCSAKSIGLGSGARTQILNANGEKKRASPARSPGSKSCSNKAWKRRTWRRVGPLGDEQKPQTELPKVWKVSRRHDFIKIHPSIFLDKNGSMLCYSFKNLHGPSG